MQGTENKHPGTLLDAQRHYQSGRLSLAEAVCAEVLRSEPDRVDALLLLALTAHRLGRPKRSIELFGRVIAVKPDHAESYKNLGFLLRGEGKLDEAIGNYRKAIVLKPDYAEAHSGLGDVFCDQENLGAAVQSYRAALSFRPDFAEVHCNLGGIFLAQGKLELALEACQKALALKPDYADAHFNLGSVFLGLGDTVAAAESFRRALQLKPDFPMAYAGLASLYAELGRFDAARGELDRALALHPDNAVALSMLPEIQKMAIDHAWLNRAQQLVSNPALPLAEAMRLLFAMGKYHDDNAQYDLAFATYAQANALRRKVDGEFDRAAHSSLIDRLISAYPADVANPRLDGASPSHRPVLIVGMPRSGTSLVEQIVASHPQAFGAGELDFWNAQAKSLGEAATSATGNAATIAKIAVEYEQLLRRLSGGTDRVVDKMPHNFLWLGLILSVFPNARIIHMQRDPLDTCLSIHCQLFLHSHPYAADLGDLGFCYSEYLRLMRHWRNILPADRFFELPYEALVADPAGWTRRLLEFIELPWADSCLEFFRKERRVATFSSWQVRQPIYTSAVGRWRNYERHMGPLIEALGADHA